MIRRGEHANRSREIGRVAARGGELRAGARRFCVDAVGDHLRSDGDLRAQRPRIDSRGHRGKDRAPRARGACQPGAARVTGLACRRSTAPLARTARGSAACAVACASTRALSDAGGVDRIGRRQPDRRSTTRRSSRSSAWQTAHVRQVRLERALLGRIERVERVGRQQLVELVVGRRLVVMSAAPRKVAIAVRRRVFTVPSGTPVRSAISECVRPFVVRELDERALVLGQRVERPAHALRLVGSDRHRLGRSIGRASGATRSRFDAGAPDRDAPCRGAQPIDRARARQHHDPAGHGRAAALVSRGIAPDLREHVLHDFLGVSAVRQNPPGQPVHRRRVPVVQSGPARPPIRRHLRTSCLSMSAAASRRANPGAQAATTLLRTGRPWEDFVPRIARRDLKSPRHPP